MEKSNYCEFLKLKEEIKLYKLENILKYSLIFIINEDKMRYIILFIYK